MRDWLKDAPNERETYWSAMGHYKKSKEDDRHSKGKMFKEAWGGGRKTRITKLKCVNNQKSGGSPKTQVKQIKRRRSYKRSSRQAKHGSELYIVWGSIKDWSLCNRFNNENQQSIFELFSISFTKILPFFYYNSEYNPDTPNIITFIECLTNNVYIYLYVNRYSESSLILVPLI